MRISDWSSDVCSSDLIAVGVLGDDAGVEEFVVKVVAFTGPLADAREHRGAAVTFGDVVDQFLDQHGLADAGTAEQADLAALGVRREQDRKSTRLNSSH